MALVTRRNFQTFFYMPKLQNIRVLIGRSLVQVNAGQCDDVRECDTLKEAKEFARYALTEAYQNSGEFSEPMNVARVMAFDGTANFSPVEYIRKGYSEPDADSEEHAKLARTFRR